MRNETVIGEQMITMLFKLVMSVKLHGQNNKAVRNMADTLLSLLRDYSNFEKFVSLKISDNRFYFQNEKIPHRRETLGFMSKARDFFLQRGIGEIRIDLQESPDHSVVIKTALYLYHANKAEDPFIWFKKKLAFENLFWIEVEKPADNKEGLEKSKTPEKVYSISPSQDFVARKEKGVRTYANAIQSIKMVAEKVSDHSFASIRKTQRMVQKMVDLIVEDDSILMGMSTIRDYDDYTYCHSVNVAILSMCLGLKIGLSRKSVEILGICGLFHDLGKVDIPSEIIQKPGRLTAEETRIVEKHSLFSVTKILKLNAPREIKAKIIRPPFEHHIKYDHSGYPRYNVNKPVSLFGRILTIADVFDAITSPRSYRPVALSPDEALGRMLEGSGTDFDPLLLKAFINMVGFYPVGTLLQLDTGELGLVSGKGKCSNGSRPDVVVIKTDKDKVYRKGPVISLEERDSTTMDYIRNIVASFHPGRFGIQPAEYLL